jgi:beta-glucosidase
MTHWEQRGFFHQNGKAPVYENSVEHWRRWREDYELLRKINVNAYRFSFDWGRLEPMRGKFNQKALGQYDKMLDWLVENKIAPMLTLHHFTHPVWFHEKTPWHTENAIETFVKFAEYIIDRFADRVPLFVSFNEPIVWLLAAYGDGKFPPGEKNLHNMMAALRHILLAHKEVYRLIKKKNPAAQVGIAKNFIVFKPHREWNLLDQGITDLAHKFYNLLVPEAFKTNKISYHFPFLINYKESIPLLDRIDFWGVNYYYRLHLRIQLNLARPFDLQFRKGRNGVSDLGWEIYPKGLGQVLGWLKSTGKAIYITENGVADRNDLHRQKFIKKHLKVVRKFIGKGYPVKGYFHWSLMDNYEWLEGKTACFGLYAVDYGDHKKRILRPSGEYYADYISKHS